MTQIQVISLHSVLKGQFHLNIFDYDLWTITFNNDSDLCVQAGVKGKLGRLLGIFEVCYEKL